MSLNRVLRGLGLTPAAIQALFTLGTGLQALAKEVVALRETRPSRSFRPKVRSKYSPHQGKAEMARRQAQLVHAPWSPVWLAPQPNFVPRPSGPGFAARVTRQQRRAQR